MNCSYSEISGMLGIPAPGVDGTVSCLLTDSRSLTYPDETLFFALRTRSNDGHRFIAPLYSAGVRAFVVDSVPDGAGLMFPGAVFFSVPNTLKALQTVAAGSRARFDIPVVGVTGSRGKTTVKEWLYQLMTADREIVRSPRSFNSQIGVPLSLWAIDSATDMAIIEAGISRPGEMGVLHNMIRPSVGVMTSLGPEHSEGFHSMEHKCAEKCLLFDGCEAVVYCADDAVVRDAVERKFGNDARIGWSTVDRRAPLFITDIASDEKSTRISYRWQGCDASVSVPFSGAGTLDNVAACLGVMLVYGYSAEVISGRMARLEPVATRLEVMEGVNGCMVVRDNFTADFRSMESALDFMNRHMTENLSSTVILGDVSHESMDPAKLYEAVASLLCAKGVTRVIGIGPRIACHSRYFGADAEFFPSTDAFMSAMSTSDFDHEMILVRGASKLGLSAIADMLEARQHETVLEVNLDAVAHNFNWFRSKLNPETGIVCMVKADGYGTGAYELTRTLQSCGAAYVAVAVLDEGVNLRRAGITMPIMVLNPKVVNYKALFANRLEPEIYSFEMLEEIIREGEKVGITDYPVHIKLDTGMHRLGFMEEDMRRLGAMLTAQDVVYPSSVFSHLATADCLDMDQYTLSQFDCFDACCAALADNYSVRPFNRHILNSAGITRFPDRQYDLVRLGIGLYGVPVLPDGMESGLRNVASLRSVIISLKNWPAGTAIGYGRRGVLSRDSVIATVPIGYADGLDRHLGCGRSSMSVNGVRCPVVGNVCMDICMIDVTDVPDVTVGSRVEIFGDNVSLQELADTLSTIPYEILTSVSQRVKRVYFRE